MKLYNCFKPLLLISLILLSNKISFAQLTDNFNDSNFSENPIWLGDTSKFTFSSGKLRSSSTIANDKFYISSQSKRVANTTWTFYINLLFNTSSLNYIDVFLSSDSAVLTGQNSGYFVRLGGTNDEICLYKKIKNTSTLIIDGKNGTLNHSNNIFKIKVICDSNFQFTLYRDSTGTGNSFIQEGTVLNNELKTSNFAGILIKQSTASFFKLHFFDDFEISKILKDTILPFVKQVESISFDTLRIVFSEKMNISTLDTANFEIDKTIGNPESVRFFDKDSTKVEIVFARKILPNLFYKLYIKNCSDNAGLKINDTLFVIIKHKFEIPKLYDILITELLADPEPQVAMPNAEFIEIYNNSNNIITLENCKLQDKTSYSVLPNIQIYPDSFLIICDKSNEKLFAKYGKTCGVNYFPSLNNSGDEIFLRTSTGNLIHRVLYSTDTYKDNFKSNGGWTLEMIDKNNPCNELNYTASVNPNGGTPGIENSVSGINPDNLKPEIYDIFIQSENTLKLVFNETIDSISGVDSNNFIINNNIIEKLQTNTQEVQIAFKNNFVKGEKYSLKIKNIKDCTGNIMSDTTLIFTLPEKPVSGDIIINEILFNPKPGGYDYIEIFNNSDKSISLKNLYLFNHNSDNKPDNFTIIDTVGRYIFPKTYKVLTNSPDWVCDNYNFNNKNAFIKLEEMPAMNDDYGHIGISDLVNTVIDEIDYYEAMHFELLTDVEGIALEKINNKITSQEKSNWTSAAATYGFGTPGIENSHNLKLSENQKFLTISPSLFSPDDDGKDDLVSITLNSTKQLAQATIIIFDINGFETKKIANNTPVGNTQSWFWNGIDNEGRKTPIGIYILYAELLSIDGKKVIEKQILTLGGK